MKLFRYYIILVTGFLFLGACNKEEQSCNDGVFTEGSEEQLDCGGVCPPCDDGEDPLPQEFLFANVQGSELSFSNRDLTKATDWVMNFQNDTISVTINFGAGDSVGSRSMKTLHSEAVYNGVTHSTLAEGNVLFTDVNHTDNRLSGFFECKFVSNQNSQDTLFVKNGDFQNIPW